MAELRLEGNLEESNLAKLMYSICRTGETGTLYLTRGKVTASIYISKGLVTFASSNDIDDRLGELLLRHGKLSYAQTEKAASHIRPGKRLGTVIVELGYLNAQDLYHYVIEQVKEIIFKLFTWTEGKYRFEIGTLPSKEVITLNIGTPDLILEGIKRITRWSRIAEAVGKLDSVYELAPGCEERLKGVTLTQGELHLLESVQSCRTLEKILENTKFSDFEACSLLWSYQIMGLVNHRDAMEAEVSELLGEALAEPKETEDLTVAIRAKLAGGEEAAPEEAAPEEAAAEKEAEEIPDKIELADEPPQSQGEPAAPAKDSDSMDLDALEASIAAKPAAEPAAPAKDSDSVDLDALEASIGAKPTAEPDFPTSALEQAVDRFNEKHTFLHSILKSELGDGVAQFLDDSLGQLDREHHPLFESARPNDSGVFPKDVLVHNIKNHSLRGYKEGLDALVAAELEAAKKVFKNPARMMVVKRGLKRIEEREEG